FCSCSGTSAVAPQKSHAWLTFSASKTEMAWQLWQRTLVRAACQPRWSSGMLRSAVARSCSTMTVSPAVVSSSSAGDVVPQYGHTSALLAGFHSASPPHAGHENFCLAVTALMRGSAVQERVERSLGDAPGRADLLALDVAGFEAADDVRFRDAERRSHLSHT